LVVDREHGLYICGHCGVMCIEGGPSTPAPSQSDWTELPEGRVYSETDQH